MSKVRNYHNLDLWCVSGVRRTTDGLHQRQAAAQRGGPQLHRPQHRHGQGRRRGENQPDMQVMFDDDGKSTYVLHWGDT